MGSLAPFGFWVYMLNLFDSKSANTLFNGLVALCLSLIIWKFTGSWWGWFVLFVPGSCLIVYGWYLTLKGD